MYEKLEKWIQNSYKAILFWGKIVQLFTFCSVGRLNICTDSVISKLLHRRRTDSGTVIWNENRSAHARPPASFRRWQNRERFFADLSSVQNQERESQVANQRSSRWSRDSWVHSPRSHASPYVLEFAKSQIRRTADEWRGQSQLIALRPRIRRCSICESSVITGHCTPWMSDRGGLCPVLPPCITLLKPYWWIWMNFH